MRKSLVIVLGLALAFIAAFGRPGGGSTVAQGAACADAEEQAFLTLINQHRATNGLGPLALSQTLSAAADAHSQDMATNDFLGHTGSDGSTVEQRFARAGYTGFTASGENVFAGDEKAAVAFDWWRNSAGHNANMLGANFGRSGSPASSRPVPSSVGIGPPPSARRSTPPAVWRAPNRAANRRRPAR